MKTITRIGTNLLEILTKRAEQIGQASGVIERKRKFSASSLLQTLVIGFQSNPEASYTDLAISAASVGVEVSPQAIEQRFTEKTATFLRAMVAESVQMSLGQQQAELANLLTRFAGVYLQDSTVISLPTELSAIWAGCGGTKGETAAVKLQVQWEYKGGEIVGLTMQNGWEQDQTSPYQHRSLPRTALRIEDLGYFCLSRLKTDSEQGVYWVSRLKTGTKVYTETGLELDLETYLQAKRANDINLKVRLGGKREVTCRLLVQRVPPEVAAERLRKLHRKAQKQGRTVSKRQQVWAKWTVLITNVPESMLAFAEVFQVYAIRWQIELLFKLWKSYFKLSAWRSQNKWRILCEFYAKLIGVVISQWFFTLLRNIPARSYFKAAFVIQHYAPLIAFCLNDCTLLPTVISHMQRCFAKACRTNSRVQKPAAYQTLAIA